MRTLKEVDALRDRLLFDGTPKPEAVRIIAEACLGWPYVFGAWGEECTPSNRKRRVRADHPTIKSKCPALNGKSCDICPWGIGVRMYDCRGFTRWLLQQVGLDISGGYVGAQYNSRTNWVQKGKISEMPDCVCCVFQHNGAKFTHTGMHVGGGKIIHCSNGVQTGYTSNKAWTHYAIPVGLYKEEEIPVDKVKPILRKGNRGQDVLALQSLLNSLGYDCGSADGVFGEKTKTAVMRFQEKHDLKVDGVVGQMTWAAIEKETAEKTDETLYRVVIEEATYSQYRKILNICPLAEAIRRD